MDGSFSVAVHCNDRHSQRHYYVSRISARGEPRIHRYGKTLTAGSPGNLLIQSAIALNCGGNYYRALRVKTYRITAPVRQQYVDPRAPRHCVSAR